VSPRLQLALRVLVSAGLLLALASLVDAAAVVDRLGRADPVWLAAGLALCAIQFAASAARWRRTAEALGVPLSRRRALADYYLAGLANQVLPGGVLGDAARATRHARSSGRSGPAVRAVILERASGQAVLLLVTLALMIATPTGREIAGALVGLARPGAWVALAAVACAVFALFRLRRRSGFGWLAVLAADARSALLTPRHAAQQLLLSLVVVAALCGTFACAGRMLGVSLPDQELVVLAPLVLMAMLIPISIGGWGVRESAAAGLFALAGHAPETGIAVSIAYGLITLLAALPGALVPLLSLRERSAAA
jgi:uncharacterized membrane protein YbhN (UPF0104 family)